MSKDEGSSILLFFFNGEPIYHGSWGVLSTADKSQKKLCSISIGPLKK